MTPTGSAEGYARGFGGAVAADEPQAALLARDILAAGGSAADAAVAAYFTMTVTLPSAASLGAGGVCLVYDRDRKLAESIDFTHPAVPGRGVVPLPAGPRGMLALHAKYGRLPWTQLVGPAESQARLGHPASRATARALAALPPGTLADPATARIFADESGNPVAEGGTIRQPDLAATLSLIRRQPTRFYGAESARRLAEAYAAAGIPVTEADIRAFAPRLGPALEVPTGNQVAHFAPTPGGLIAAQTWAMLFREGTFGRAARDDRAHLVAEVSRRAYADAGRWLAAPENLPADPAEAVAPARIRALLDGYRADARGGFKVPGGAAPAPAAPLSDGGSAGVVAADLYGQAVACAFTMNGALGAGRIVPGTGIVAARAPAPGEGVPALAVMALGLGTQRQLEYLGTATGGAAGPVTLAAGAARMLLENRTAEEIVEAPRFVAPGPDAPVTVEDRADARALADDLARRGHGIARAPALGRLNLFVCPAGFAGADSQCDIRTDRRGFGFAQLY